MKKGILFLLLLTAVAASAQEKKQSLKDLLYGGKLKMDSNSVIRKGDDLSSKIDTTTKKPVETPKPQATTTTAATTTATTVAVGNNEPKQVEKTVDAAKDDAASTVVVPGENDATATPVKSNSKVLKEYTATLIAGLTSEVLPSKKIKKETYFVTVDYEIGTEGQFTVTGVTSDPENEFLQGQVRDRIESAPPQLSPVTGSDGKAKKQKKRHNFSITKE